MKKRIIWTTLFGAVFMLASLWIFSSCFEVAPSQKELESALDMMERREFPRANAVLKDIIPRIKDEETRDKYLYASATSYRKQHRWREAIRDYRAAIKGDGFEFADLAMLHIAQCFGHLEDYESAIKWYEKVLNSFPDSFVAQKAQYELGQSYFGAELYEKAIKCFEAYLEHYPEEKRARMAEYKIAKTFQEMGQCKESYHRYQVLLHKNQRDAIARRILEDLQPILSDCQTISVTEEERMDFALALFYAGQYDGAREELGRLRDGTGNLAAKAAYFIAESYLRERKYSTAIKQYKAVVNTYPKSDYVPGSLFQIAVCYGRKKDLSRSCNLLAEFVSKYPQSSLADNAQFLIGENRRSKKQYKDAIAAYAKLVEAYPDSSLADDALWYKGWLYWRLGNDMKSQQALHDLLSMYRDSRFAGAARFWIAVGTDKRGEWQEAAQLYDEIISRRDWYYSGRAKKRLESLRMDNKAKLSEIHTRSDSDETDLTYMEATDRIPTTAQDLIELRIFDDAVSVLLAAAKTSDDLSSIYYYLSNHD